MKKQNEEKFEGYTRITEILSPYMDFSHIETRVHRYCDLYVKNLLIEPVDEDCKPYIDSFIDWFDFIVDEVIQSEQRLFCDRWKITGQIDLILKLKNTDATFLVDIKTQQQKSSSWALQTAAYKYLVEDSSTQKITHRGCLMLDSNGQVPTMIEYKYHKRDIDFFSLAYKLHKYFKEQ